MIKRWRSFFNPEHFQGWGKTEKYFEGWYFKIISKDASNALAIIPGIAIEGKGKSHAFIQVLDGIGKTAEYHRFPAEEFVPSKKSFDIRVGTNRFTSSFIELNLPSLCGRIDFAGCVPWPKPFYSPGIMGPYAFIPFMECYHGIVSMDHQLHGILVKDGQSLSFEGGRGYTEKDWGRSFPSAYLWMQSNHFTREGVSLKLSVAKIPWIKSAFVGFIAGFWLNGQLIRFTTYNSTRLVSCQISVDTVAVILENTSYKLQINAKRVNATTLAAPILGMMDGRIEESMSSEIHAVLMEKPSGKILFDDIGRHAAIEVAGIVDELIVS